MRTAWLHDCMSPVQCMVTVSSCRFQAQAVQCAQAGCRQVSGSVLSSPTLWSSSSSFIILLTSHWHYDLIIIIIILTDTDRSSSSTQVSFPYPFLHTDTIPYQNLSSHHISHTQWCRGAPAGPPGQCTLYQCVPIHYDVSALHYSHTLTLSKHPPGYLSLYQPQAASTQDIEDILIKLKEINGF